MATLAMLLETLKSFDSTADNATRPVDPRLVRQRNLCPSCGACAQDLFDANQSVLKQKNINNGLQRLLDMERSDHDKLKQEYRDLCKHLDDTKRALDQRDAEFANLRTRIQTVINEAAKVHAEFDLEPPCKRTKR